MKGGMGTDDEVPKSTIDNEEVYKLTLIPMFLRYCSNSALIALHASTIDYPVEDTSMDFGG